jgi:N-methylhydantoinase A
MEETAEGILRVADAAMARAIRRVSVQRGHDPRNFALLPFGGAGGLHAARLAELLGLRRILIPPHPGILSACGMLAAVPGHEFSLAVLISVAAELDDAALLALPEVAAASGTLRENGIRALEADGVPEDQRRLLLFFDLRYQGQSFELTVPAEDGGILKNFEGQHHRLYGYLPQDRQVELVTARLRATASGGGLELPALKRRGADDAPLQTGTTVVLGAAQPYTLVARERLIAGDALSGPAIVTEYSATTVIPPGWQAEVLDSGFIRLEREELA